MTKPEDNIAKIDLLSHDIAEARRQELLRIFPEAHTESGGINFDTLRRSLGDAVQTGPEDFGMSWAGKVEMIYTGPPYNTGNDFIYPDN